MIKNLIYESKIISEVYIADSFMKRFLGYMFHKEPHYQAILIKPCNSIHTFFMRFAIDVLILDGNMKVIKKYEDLEPGKIVMPYKEGKMVIEGRTGMFKDIHEGKRLTVLDIQQ